MTELEEAAAAAKAAAKAAKEAAAAPKPSGNTSIERAVRNTGFNPERETRRVRVLKTSYVNEAIHEAGAIVYWPAGVEVLGPNLEEYKG